MPHVRYSPIGDYTPLHVTSTGTTVPVGSLVSTTSATTITAGANVVVTPASMSNIFAGMQLNVANGTGTAENVLVTAIDKGAGTFTATFANNHSGAYTIISLRGSYLGSVVVGAAGSGVTITLYNGHPSTLPVAGTSFSVLTPAVGASYVFNCWCPRGLFYTLAGTPGDYTINAADSGV